MKSKTWQDLIKAPTGDPVLDLAAAVIARAIKDYRDCLQGNGQITFQNQCVAFTEELDGFFASEWFGTLSLGAVKLADIKRYCAAPPLRRHGRDVYEQVRHRVYYEMNRDEILEKQRKRREAKKAASK